MRFNIALLRLILNYCIKTTDKFIFITTNQCETATNKNDFFNRKIKNNINYIMKLRKFKLFTINYQLSYSTKTT